MASLTPLSSPPAPLNGTLGYPSSYPTSYPNPYIQAGISPADHAKSFYAMLSAARGQMYPNVLATTPTTMLANSTTQGTKRTREAVASPQDGTKRPCTTVQAPSSSSSVKTPDGKTPAAVKISSLPLPELKVPSPPDVKAPSPVESQTLSPAVLALRASATDETPPSTPTFKTHYYHDDLGDIIPDYTIKRPGCDVHITVGDVELHYSRFLLSRPPVPKVWRDALAESKDGSLKLDVNAQHVCIILGWLETGISGPHMFWFKRLMKQMKLDKPAAWLIGLADTCKTVGCDLLRRAVVSSFLLEEGTICNTPAYEFLTRHNVSTLDMIVKASRVKDISDSHFADLRFFIHMERMTSVNETKQAKLNALCQYLHCISKDIFKSSYCWIATMLKRLNINDTDLTPLLTGKPDHVVNHINRIIDLLKLA